MEAVKFLRRWVLHDTAPAEIKARVDERKEAKPLLVVQDRNNLNDSLKDYYEVHHLAPEKNKVMSKRKTYGSVRRHVENLREVSMKCMIKTVTYLINTVYPQVADALRDETQYEVQHIASDDNLTLKQQICQYSSANALVMGHGAGMIHLLWMRPDSTIVEVIPAEKLGHYNGGVQGCLRLATLCEFKLRRLVCEKTHCAIDVGSVVDAVKRAGELSHVGGEAGACFFLATLLPVQILLSLSRSSMQHLQYWWAFGPTR